MPPLPAPQYRPPPAGPRRARNISDLIMRRGDIAARGAMRSGMIWGNVANQLGQIGSQAVQQHGAQKQAQAADAQAAQTSAAIASILESPETWTGDPQSVVKAFIGAGVEPRMAFGYTKTLQDFRELREAPDPDKARAALPGMAGVILALPPEKRADAYGAARGVLIASQLGTEENFPAQWSEEMVPTLEGLVRGMDPREEKGPSYGPATDFILQKYGPNPTTEQVTAGVEEFSRAGRVTPEEAGAVSGARARAVTAERPEGAIRFLPRQISSGGKDMMANYDPKSGKFYHTTSGEELKDVAPMGGATERNRKTAAGTSIKSGEQLIEEIGKDVGPILGRYNSLLAAAGFGDPKAQYLVGAIRSFAALQPQVHGFRAYKMAEEIENLLSTAQTPEALEAALRGVLTASYYVADREPPGLDFLGEGDGQNQEMEDMARLLSQLTPEQFDAVMGDE